jgi:serine/threonine-protein kinase SRPK3
MNKNKILKKESVSSTESYDLSDSGSETESYESGSESSGSESSESGSSSSTEEEDFEFDVIKNDYLILYKLGSGAFSTVWLAYQLSKDDFVAIKIQNPDCYDEGILEKSCLEITSKFHTETLIKMHDSFEIEKDGNIYVCLVLELAIDSAYYFLKKYKKINSTGIPSIIMRKLHNDISEALSYLHANELLHTDIKPENILVCGKDKRIIAIKKKLDEIKFKQICDQQLEEFKSKINFNSKNAKDKYRKGKKKILLEIVKQLAEILKIDDIYDDLKYLEYTDQELLQCTFKLADLGTVHSLNDMKERKRFPCIQTRYYRAPEVIIRIPYDVYVDYWSLAVMYYELTEANILFNPHHTSDLTTDQVHLFEIVQLIGCPDLSKIKEPYLSNILKKYFTTDGKLKYSTKYTKPEFHPEKWDSEVFNFFQENFRWH